VKEQEEKVGPPTRLRTLDVFASILVLFNLAFAQPLLDILGRNPEFFLARAAPSSDIVVVALLVAVGLPLIVAAFVALAKRVSDAVGHLAHGAVFWFLASLLVLGVVTRLVSGASGWLLIVVSGVAGAGVLALYRSTDAFRSLFRLALPVPVVVAGLFLLASPSSELISDDGVAVAEVALSDPAPVVFVTFDELPIASLMDLDRRIDASLFPNFARLAAGSTWFRNAATVSDHTSAAVPAMLDGQFPEPGVRRLPIAADRPHNVFTLLGGAMPVHAAERLTRMCPASVCPTGPPEAFRARWGGMTSDVAIIAGHVALPEDLRGSLPPIGESWSGFAEAAADANKPAHVVGKGNPAADFRSFVEAIQANDDPVFHFAHVMLPHAPWRFFPSGQQYPHVLPVLGTEPLPGRTGSSWSTDEWLITQGYQRHLLQTKLADELLGDLLDRLDETGLYDRSVLVVAADHGASFVPGEPRRDATAANVGGVVAVPLFVKEPHQDERRISDVPALTIDILPTIADVVGVSELWDDIDGVSLISDAAERRADTELTVSGVTFPATLEQKYDVLRNKFRLLAGGGGELDLYGIGPGGTGSLVGREVADLGVGPPSEMSAETRVLRRFADVDLDAPRIPAWFEGALTAANGSPTEGGSVLAVALNGTIAAVTRPQVGGTEFYAILHPRLLRDGRNEVELFEVQAGAPSGPALRPVRLTRS